MNPNIYSSSSFEPSEQAQTSNTASQGAGFLQPLKKLLNRQAIDQDIIKLHHQAFSRAKHIGIIAQAIDKKEFREQEFLFFITVKNNFLKGLGDYRGLNHSLRLFRVAVEAQNSFLKIEQTELIYRSSYQQDFYHLIFDLLSRNVTTSYFYQKVHEKFTEVVPLIRTQKGKKALHSYLQALDALAKQDQLGLRLLFLFKKHQLTDYSILRNVSDIVRSLKHQNLRDINSLIAIVNKHYYMFEHLGKIIGVPSTRSNAKTYALMLQYLALRHKYQKKYLQFEKLIEILKDWEKCYTTLQDIRQKHPSLKYERPPEFKESPLGQKIYQKYKSYLT